MSCQNLFRNSIGNNVNVIDDMDNADDVDKADDVDNVDDIDNIDDVEFFKFSEGRSCKHASSNMSWSALILSITSLN